MRTLVFDISNEEKQKFVTNKFGNFSMVENLHYLSVVSLVLRLRLRLRHFSVYQVIILRNSIPVAKKYASFKSEYFVSTLRAC